MERKGPQIEKSCLGTASPIALRLVDDLVDEYLAGELKHGDFCQTAAKRLGVDPGCVADALCELVRRYRSAYYGLRTAVAGAMEEGDQVLKRRAA